MQTRRFATFGTRAPAYATHRSLGMGLRGPESNSNRIYLGGHHLGARRSSPCLHRSSQQPLQMFAQETYIVPVVHETPSGDVSTVFALSASLRGDQVGMALGSATLGDDIAVTGLWTEFQAGYGCAKPYFGV
jgi:hypothetical protein